MKKIKRFGRKDIMKIFNILFLIIFACSSRTLSKINPDFIALQQQLCILEREITNYEFNKPNRNSEISVLAKYEMKMKQMKNELKNMKQRLDVMMQ